jgi:serine phosphatase RsbU (regulator of sigma subunit)
MTRMRLEQPLLRIAGKLGYQVGALEDAERMQLLRELLGVLYGALLAVPGLVWLALATDLGLVLGAWPIFALLLLLAVLLNWLDFFWIVERHGGPYERWSAPLSGLVTISAVLVFGPSAIWLGLIVTLVAYVRARHATAVGLLHLGALRTLMLNSGSFSIGALLGLWLYQALGGTFPLPGFNLQVAPIAALAVATLLAFDWLCWSGYLLLTGWIQPSRAGMEDLGLFAFFEVVAYLPEFYGILAAAVYVQIGIAGYLVVIAGALLVSRLAQRLSLAAERSAQRSRELSQLEQLGRALIIAPADMSTLPEILATFVPPMFRANRIEIRLFSGELLLHTPAQAPPAAAPVWEWLRQAERPHSVRAGERAPWLGQPATHPLAAAPIVGTDAASVLGGIFIRFSPTVEDPAEALPALQSLAAQVASALFRAEEHHRALAHQRIVQELSVAAEIQASFLPEQLPRLPGWQLAAALRPALQISGDFYDVIELPGGRLGLVIADVTDKGTGAALFMALSRTLIRTYAFEYPDQPEKALHAANKRILLDSRSSMFVTVFYGILDPARGTLTYCNAGHNPPYHLRTSAEPVPLRNTGIPLGITTDTAWRTEMACMGHGDMVILYTDGITEAHNVESELFEVERMLAAALSSPQRSAEDTQAAILAAVDRFAGEAPQHDDLTLLIVGRE